MGMTSSHDSRQDALVSEFKAQAQNYLSSNVDEHETASLIDQLIETGVRNLARHDMLEDENAVQKAREDLDRFLGLMVARAERQLQAGGPPRTVVGGNQFSYAKSAFCPCFPFC